MPVKLSYKTGLLPIIALLAAGCVTPTTQMKSFVGKSQQDVYRAWGPPTEKRPDAKGGQMWIYRSTDQIGGNTWDKTRAIYFDKDGIVYGWKWKGL